MAAGHPPHRGWRRGRQRAKVRVGLVEGKQCVVLALDDQRRSPDRRHDLFQAGLVQQRAELRIRLAGLGCLEITPAQGWVESTAELSATLRMLISRVRPYGG